jgi:hypothetical protein
MSDYKWVKVKGSDFREYFPVIGYRQVFHEDGIHWHSEEILSNEKKRVICPPVVLQDNEDGTYTAWGSGRIGSSGSLREGQTVVPLTTKRDFVERDRIKRNLSY